jgi:hypothetical protein
MIRVLIPVPDIATKIASYNKIEIGRANNKADADARTGTWASLGQVVTLVPLVSQYRYDDDAAADGYYHTYRIINSSNNSATAWVTTKGKTLGYLTADEFREYQLGDLTDKNGTDLADATLDSFIATASRLVDAYVGYSFQYRQTTERHIWQQKNRRVYPREKPIVAVSAFRVYVSNQQNAAFTVNDVYLNPDRGYLEVTSLANVTYSLFPAIVALGLIEPVAEITYTHGYQFTPSDVKDAVALTAVDMIARDSLAKQGMTGLSRLRIGEMEMYSDQLASRSGQQSVHTLPPAAATILEQYRFISVR